MNLSEDEARTKACPFATSFDASHGRRVYNKDASSKPSEGPMSMCIGSACMAWEFIDYEWMQPALYELNRYGLEFPKEIKPPLKTWVAGKQAEDEEAKKAFDEEYPDFDWFKVNDQSAIDAGWEMNPTSKFGESGTKTISRWRRKRPVRNGQCGRVHFIDITQG